MVEPGTRQSRAASGLSLASSTRTAAAASGQPSASRSCCLRTRRATACDLRLQYRAARLAASSGDSPGSTSTLAPQSGQATRFTAHRPRRMPRTGKRREPRGQPASAVQGSGASNGHRSGPERDRSEGARSPCGFRLAHESRPGPQQSRRRLAEGRRDERLSVGDDIIRSREPLGHAALERVTASLTGAQSRHALRSRSPLRPIGPAGLGLLCAHGATSAICRPW